MKKMLYFLVAILMAFNIFLLVKVKSNSTPGKNEIRNLTPDQIEEVSTDAFVEMLTDQISTEGLKLDTSLVLKRSNDSNVPVNDLLLDKPKLIVNLVNENCKSCVDHELILLEKFANLIGRNNIILIKEFGTRRAHKVFENENKFVVLNIKNGSFGLPIENQGVPFLFISDKSKTVKDIYVPWSGIKAFSENYYNIIYSKYFI